MAYTKLFSSIVNSTVWLEDHETRILWITMLALADKHGEVRSSIPGLCKQAGVSLEGALKALAKFQAPDPLSTSKEAEGRRIEEIDGGWALINYDKYRRMASLADKAEKSAERQRRFKERKRAGVTETHDNENGGSGNAPVTHLPAESNALNRQAEAEAEADSRKEDHAAAASSSASAREISAEPVKAGPNTEFIPAPLNQIQPEPEVEYPPGEAPHGYEEDGVTPIRTTPMPKDDYMPMPAELPKAPPPVQVVKAEGDKSPEAAAFNAYNHCASLQGWPQAQFMNSTVRYRLQAGLAMVGGMPGWMDALVKASNAEFLRTPDGKAQRWVNLDWISDSEHLRKLMEGRYDQRHDAGNGAKPTTGGTVEALARLAGEGTG